VQVAYAIGVADPMNITINDYGTAKVDPKKLAIAVREIWNLKPAAIVKQFDLLKPRYLKTAAYGHFGRNEPEFTWEALDKVQALKSLCQ
jgi:S-adenosylmethionine synthetase